MFVEAWREGRDKWRNEGVTAVSFCSMEKQRSGDGLSFQKVSPKKHGFPNDVNILKKSYV